MLAAAVVASVAAGDRGARPIVATLVVGVAGIALVLIGDAHGLAFLGGVLGGGIAQVLHDGVRGHGRGQVRGVTMTRPHWSRA